MQHCNGRQELKQVVSGQKRGARHATAASGTKASGMCSTARLDLSLLSSPLSPSCPVPTHTVISFPAASFMNLSIGNVDWEGKADMDKAACGAQGVTLCKRQPASGDGDPTKLPHFSSKGEPRQTERMACTRGREACWSRNSWALSTSRPPAWHVRSMHTCPVYLTTASSCVPS